MSHLKIFPLASSILLMMRLDSTVLSQMTAFRLYVLGVDYNPRAHCAVFTMFVYVMCSLLCFRFYFCYLGQFVFIFKQLSLCWHFLQFSLNCSLSGFSTVLVFPAAITEHHKICGLITKQMYYLKLFDQVSSRLQSCLEAPRKNPLPSSLRLWAELSSLWLWN